jgi:acyl carrier protein
LDKVGRVVPGGTPGEIYIGGEQVMKGYKGEGGSGLLSDPYRSGERMYRTGDVGCWGADGELRYLGRVDDQVKLRGYRIEPGEIEGQLEGHAGVRQAVVVCRERLGEKYLAVYYVGAVGLERELREYLQERVPGYMVPEYYIRMEGMPLTVNGKVDRKGLPEPEEAGRGVDHASASNEWEERLVDIWSEVLGRSRETISVTANFFETGGNSLRAISLAAKINKAFEVNIPIVDIFKHTTIRKLSQLLYSTPEPETGSARDEADLLEDMLWTIQNIPE